MCVLCYNPALVVGDAVLFGGPVVGSVIHRIRSGRRAPEPSPETGYGPGIPLRGAAESASSPSRPLRAAAVIAR
jgi:hypothetical protein